jgi:hypothetical protein
MNCEVWWANQFPAEVREAVAPLIQKHAHRLPRWCCHLSMRYGPPPAGMEESVAVMETQFQYRHAKMLITSRFLEDNKANRERAIIHELGHVPMGAMNAWVHQLLQTWVEDEATRDQFSQQYQDLEEGVVQDFTYMLRPPASPR